MSTDHLMSSLNHRIQIKFANTKSEKEEIYRFRYEVFVEELSTPVQNADHQSKKISDELDAHSILLYALAGSKIIGTARMAIYNMENFPNWIAATFYLKKFKSILHNYDNTKIGLSTKIAIAPAYRGSTVMYRLISEIYKIYSKHQIQLSFSGGNPRMIQLYERVGYRRFTSNFTEPGYGLLVPFVFIHDDIAHLKAVNSPLYRVAPKINHSVLAERFYQAFPKAKEYINSQIKNSSLQYIKYLFDGRIKHFPPLNNLNEQERNTLIQLGAIFHCNKGDIITTVGEISNELYFLLSGTLSATSASCSHLLQPGHCFGCGINGPKPYEQQITAVTEADLLIISNHVFAKFSHLHPLAAKKLLQASLSLQLIVNNQGR